MNLSALPILAQTETSTATWAVLMVVLTALVATGLAVYRVMTMKIAKAESDAHVSESKLADSRHNEMKTLVESVGSDVLAVGSRTDKIERDVTDLKIGHAELHQRVDGLNRKAENE